MSAGEWAVSRGGPLQLGSPPPPSTRLLLSLPSRLHTGPGLRPYTLPPVHELMKKIEEKCQESQPVCVGGDVGAR